MDKPEIHISKQFAKILKKNPDKIKLAFVKRLDLFIEDPTHALVDNHPLIGNYKGYYSINITGDYRALYSIREIGGRVVYYFELIGTHSQLYGKQK